MKPREIIKIVKEGLCECGHKQSEHMPYPSKFKEATILEEGHGKCKKCKCVQFTWTKHIGYK